MAINCIDLRERFGGKYRITHEEPATVRNTDPWYYLIPCQHGQIYPHGGDMLGFASRTHGGIAQRVASLDFTTVTQDGTDGMNIVFSVEHFDQVAEIVKPRRRRHLSEEHKNKLLEAQAAFRQQHPDWKPGERIAQDDFTDQGREQRPSDDSEHHVSEELRK